MGGVVGRVVVQLITFSLPTRVEVSLRLSWAVTTVHLSQYYIYYYFIYTTLYIFYCTQSVFSMASISVDCGKYIAIIYVLVDSLVPTTI